MERNYIYQKFKEICLLLAGSLISLALLPFEDGLKIQWFHLLLLSTVLMLIGIGLLDGLKNVYFILSLVVNRKIGLIGIYAPYEIDDDNSSWVNLSKRQLENMLKKYKINYRVFDSDIFFRRYPIIINPYGGVYPENNIATLESLENIFHYVREGGIYVNIADIPFYYAFDKNLSRRVDTTPFAGPFTRTVSFLHTILTKKLQVFVYGLSDKKYIDKGISRVISNNDDTFNYYEEKITMGDENYSPYLAIPYGKGFFVFSTKLIGKMDELKIIDILNKSLELINQ